MASLFTKDLGYRQPTVYERIAPEIAHLRKGVSVRYGAGAKVNGAAPWVTAIAICGLLGLYFMDPFLYALNKADAIRAYLYLHNHDSAASTEALIGTQIFTQDEIDAMNRQRDVSQETFASPLQAEQQAAAVVSYINSIKALRSGDYDQLDPIGKLRYLLFIRTGIFPPTIWSGLNPTASP